MDANHLLRIIEGYPASVCVSINEEVVHGIPRKDRIIEEGDIVSLDTGVIYKGYQSDAARTIAIGEISKEAQQLIDVTKQSFFEGIKFAKKETIYMIYLQQSAIMQKIWIRCCKRISRSWNWYRNA